MKITPKLLLLGCTIGLTACQTAKPVTLKQLEPLPQDPNIQVFTNHNPAHRFKDVYLQRERLGDDLEQVILAAINSAQTSIDIAVQEFRLPRIAQALKAKQQAGVAIRVIMENTYRQPHSSFSEAELAKLPDRERDRILEGRKLIDQNQDGQLSPDEIAQNDALITLEQAGIKLIDDTEDGSKGSDLMHHKFAIVDGQTVIVTSANFTISDMVGDFGASASTGNANTLLKIQSVPLAQIFREEFNLLWGDGPGGLPNGRFGIKKPDRGVRTVMIDQTPVTVQFSPTTKASPWESSTNGLISRTLQSAQQSIDLALFVFSDQKLVNSLEPLPDRQVKIRALVDSGFIYRPYSEALDMMGITIAQNCKVEQANHPWQHPLATVGTPKMPPGDLLHHKFGVIDRSTVIVGSHNWTDAANQGNDETLLVIPNPTVAAHYQREFERLTENAFFGIPPAIAKKAAANSCDPVAPSEPSPKASPENQTADRVNLNTASKETIDQLPGISAKVADRIIEQRQTQPIRSLEDLDRIPGIGAKTLKKIEHKVTW
jgi:competence ComEA-like helix-hairpin-helix protein